MPAIDIAQTRHNCSEMGVLIPVRRFLHPEVETSDEFCFAASGMAFVINIHTQICPSGPYCYDGGSMEDNVAGLGVRMTNLGYFDRRQRALPTAELEDALRVHLDRGLPAAIINYEWQLVLGYDADGFDLAQPWCDQPVTPARLTCGDWPEFGEQYHASFFTYGPGDPDPRETQIARALRYAVAIGGPAADETHYARGLGAYARWIAAIEAGHGGDVHGQWWNATVWSECRANAGAFFAEIAAEVGPHAADARALAEDYGRIAAALARAADRQLPPAGQIAALREAEQVETAAIARLRTWV